MFITPHFPSGPLDIRFLDDDYCATDGVDLSHHAATAPAAAATSAGLPALFDGSSAYGSDDGSGPAELRGTVAGEELVRGPTGAAEFAQVTVPTVALDSDIGDIRCHNIQYSGRLVRLSSRKCKDEGTEAMLREYLGGVGTTLLEKFADLRLTMYKYKAGCGGDPDEWHIGFIAEEVLEVSTVT